MQLKYSEWTVAFVSLLTAAGLSAEELAADRCVVQGPDRFACVVDAQGQKPGIFIRDGARSREQTLPGPLSWPLQMGSVRSVVLVKGLLSETAGREPTLRKDSGIWARLIGLDGATGLSLDGRYGVGMAATGDWLAVEPRASESPELVVYDWEGREARRLPGRRVFMRHPEDEDDDYSFSGDGRAVVVYRSERQAFDIFGLDGGVPDETVLLSESARNFAAKEFRFVDADTIVMWQFEMFGREEAEWLRVLRRQPSGKWVSRSIVHENGYTDVRRIASDGRILLAGEHGFDVVDTFGRLIWRMNYSGWSELVEVMPEKDLQRWQPALLPGGDIVLRKYGRGTGVGRSPVESVLVRLSRADEGGWPSLDLDERLVVVHDSDRPRARVSTVAEVPPDAAISADGRHLLLDPTEGTRQVTDSRTGLPAEY